jgi:CubicO group peptidase (beta-lactamase class C family)
MPSGAGAAFPAAGCKERGALTAVVELEMKARVGEILNRWPAVGLAVGVVRNGSLDSFSADGVADIGSNAPITQDTIFRVASIIKTFTAIAVMQLCEQGRIDLDAPASDYLRACRLVPAKASFRPATVRHLLTHTAGIGEMAHPSGVLRPDFGESFGEGRPVPSLAEYYHGGLRIGAEPGTRFTYTNHGPATLGQIVEDVSGEPLARYLREHIFGPLGMADTSLVRSELDHSRLATGYTMGSQGAKPVVYREMVTAGAASACSSTRDMARYVAALLGGGANEHGSVLRPGTLATSPLPPGPCWPCCGCQVKQPGSSTICLGSGTTPSALTSRTIPGYGATSAAGTTFRGRSPMPGRGACWAPEPKSSSAVASSCSGA